MANNYTIEELEILLGENIKRLRLIKNADRATLCESAGISLNALRNLENGSGANLKTLIRVTRALGRLEWLNVIAPKVSVNPMHMVRGKPLRQRASRRKKTDV